jgi:hypothetical protein
MMLIPEIKSCKIKDCGLSVIMGKSKPNRKLANFRNISHFIFFKLKLQSDQKPMNTIQFSISGV